MMTTTDAAIDAAFVPIPGSDLALQREAVPAMRMTTEEMLGRLAEWENFKARAVPPDAWIRIPGMQGKYLPAAEVMRLAPAAAVSWPIISRDEHGDFGVRRAIVEDLNARGDLVKKVVYTVTIRATDGNGRFIDMVGSFDSTEGKKSDYFARQQALTRARRKATLTLMGGVDEDAAEDVRAQRRDAAQDRTETKPPSARALLERAVRLGCARDPESFVAWCAAAADVHKMRGDNLATDEKRQIVAALDREEAALEPPEAEDQ